MNPTVMSAAADDIFIGAHFAQPHRAAGVQLLRGDAHFAAEAELAAVGEAGGGVDVDRGAVHVLHKVSLRGGVARDDGVAVAGGVRRDVGDGLVHVGDDLDREDVVEKLRVEVMFARGGAGDDRCRLGVQAQLHALPDAGCQPGQEVRGDGPVHQQNLLGVADAGAAGLGVFDDVQRHVEVGALLHIDVADAGARGDAGDGGLPDAGADQPGPAAGDQQVHIALRRHKRPGALTGGVLHEVDRVFGDAQGCQRRAQGVHDGVGAAEGLLPAAQDADAAAFQRQRRRVAGDIGAAFVDDGDDAHRHRDLRDAQAVRADVLLQHPAHGVRERGDIADALRHAGDALRRQAQAVQHHVADRARGGVQVRGVGG